MDSFTLLKDITGKKYVGFIDYALQSSTSCTFFLPYFYVLNPEMMEGLPPEAAQNAAAPETTSDPYKTEWERYIRRMEARIEPIRDSVLHCGRDFQYLGFGYGHLCETYRLRLDRDCVKEFLVSENSLFSWRYPNAPEDISFFRGDTVWCRTVAHEKRAFFDGISPQEAALIRKRFVRWGRIK